MWSPRQAWDAAGEAVPSELEPGSSGSSCSGSSRKSLLPWPRRLLPLEAKGECRARHRL